MEKTSSRSSKGKETPPTFEPLSSKPVVMPAGMHRPPSLNDDIQRLVYGALSQHAAKRGEETYEESLDFGEDGEEDNTPWEYQADARQVRRDIAFQEEYDRRLAQAVAARLAKEQLSKKPRKSAPANAEDDLRGPGGSGGQGPQPRRKPRPRPQPDEEEGFE